MAPGTVVAFISFPVPHTNAWFVMGKEAGLITMALAQVVACAVVEAIPSRMSRNNRTGRPDHTMVSDRERSF